MLCKLTILTNVTMLTDVMYELSSQDTNHMFLYSFSFFFLLISIVLLFKFFSFLFILSFKRTHTYLNFTYTFKHFKLNIPYDLLNIHWINWISDILPYIKWGLLFFSIGYGFRFWFVNPPPPPSYT